MSKLDGAPLNGRINLALLLIIEAERLDKWQIASTTTPMKRFGRLEKF
jgi:hypothetical protein